MLRKLLAAYAGASDPEALRFTYGSHGKPALARAPGDHRVTFNLAHSGGFALLGVSHDVELGVDVERASAFDDMAAVMRTSFSTDERDDIERLDAADRVDAFYRCWTRKEAVLKALGWGLAMPLDSFRVDVSTERPSVLSMAGRPGADHEWQMIHLTPAPGFIGAVAWQGAPMTTRCYLHAA
jgi:4'-phosphopantetheinyl transferase